MDTGFEPLELDVEGLRQNYKLRWKVLDATEGPPGAAGEPYIPLPVSFVASDGDRRTHGYLDYALSRSFWSKQDPPAPGEVDVRTIERLVRERLPEDLALLDSGGAPEALREGETPPKFLRP